MVKYIKANRYGIGDIVVTYRNKIIYEGPISAEPTEVFKNIKNFNPDENYEDEYLVRWFEKYQEGDYSWTPSISMSLPTPA